MTETKLTASELRLGNWVEFNDFPGKHFTKITIDKLKTIADNPIMHTWYAIPLTPEILEKAGFRDIYKRGEVYKIKSSITKQVYKSRRHGKWYFQYKSAALIEYTIDYVHQLQNLYFALTGEELEINL